MKRFVFALALALALLAGSQSTARADGCFSIGIGFSIGFSVTSNCQKGYCPPPAPCYYAPPAPCYGYYSPYPYCGGYGY